MNVKLANANALLAGKVIAVSVHHHYKSTALMEMARSAVEEEHVCVEGAGALSPAVWAAYVNSAPIAEQLAVTSGMFVLTEMSLGAFNICCAKANVDIVHPIASQSLYSNPCSVLL